MKTLGRLIRRVLQPLASRSAPVALITALSATGALAQGINDAEDASTLYTVGMTDILNGEVERGLVSLEIAANEGGSHAAAALATINHFGVKRSADFAQAAQLAASAAAAGNVKGARMLGWMQLTGQGVRENPREALRYLQMAADQEDTHGLYLLGRLLEAGARGVERDIPAAMSLYEKALDDDYPFAKWRLAELMLSESANASEKALAATLLEEAAADGVISSRTAYARQLFRGEGAVQNYTQAFANYLYAAELGDPVAQNMVGYMLLSGLGTSAYLKHKEFGAQEAAEMAYFMLLRAAIQKNSRALYNLGELFRARGDYVSAHAFYNLASSGGTDEAARKRAIVQERLTPAQLQAAQFYASNWPNQFTLETRGTGSGFFISLGGAVVTNHHVVNDCDVVRVRTGDTTHPASIMLARKDVDIAVLQIDRQEGVAHDFRVARLAPEEERAVGEKVAVFGWPYASVLSAEGSFTTGILSATQGIRGNQNFIQISAPVNPGNSGGPVFNETGRVIGVVASQLAFERQQNTNFAVKVGVLMRILDKFEHPYYPESSAGEAPMDSRELYKLARASSAHIICLAYEPKTND